MISEQTIKPSFVEIVNDDNIAWDLIKTRPEIDVALRYKIGIERCKTKGADIIIFWEDDDWYKYNYIELMLKHWVLAGKPTIFGISRTIYYNIVKRMFRPLNHPGRASMMSTIVTKDFEPKWNYDHDPFVDMFLWKSNDFSKGTIDIPFDKSIAIGIKHGIGSTAGGGHKWPAEKFPYSDKELIYLSNIIDKDSLIFYEKFYAG